MPPRSSMIELCDPRHVSPGRALVEWLGCLIVSLAIVAAVAVFCVLYTVYVLFWLGPTCLFKAKRHA